MMLIKTNEKINKLTKLLCNIVGFILVLFIETKCHVKMLFVYIYESLKLKIKMREKVY